MSTEFIAIHGLARAHNAFRPNLLLDVVHCDKLKLNDKLIANACYTGSTGSTGLPNNY